MMQTECNRDKEKQGIRIQRAHRCKVHVDKRCCNSRPYMHIVLQVILRDAIYALHGISCNRFIDFRSRKINVAKLFRILSRYQTIIIDVPEIK